MLLWTKIWKDKVIDQLIIMDRYGCRIRRLSGGICAVKSGTLCSPKYGLAH